jgi:type II secretory pathway pseudopilin PulG
MRRRPLSPTRNAAGYSLVILLVILTGMTIAISASLPLWSAVSRRDKEAELIYRGLQYAEAIRVFRTRYGRAPVKLEELMEVKPRCIRQLWKDPMTEDGEWEIVLEGGPGGQVNPNQPNQPNQPNRPNRQQLQQQDPNGRNLGPSGLPQSSGGAFANPDGRVVGPIAGVRSRSTDNALRVFMDNQTYDQWVFTYDMVSGHAALPDRAPIVASYRTLGRPFRPGLTPAVTLQPQQQGGPGEGGQPAIPPQGGNPGQRGIPTQGEGERGPNGRPPLVPDGQGQGLGGRRPGGGQGLGLGLPTNPLGGSQGLGRPGSGPPGLQPEGRPNANPGGSSGANPE